MRFIDYHLPPMDTSLLKTFLLLAETNNFTLAAQKLYRSQSAISLQIARLESLLGKTLFTRDNRNVALTLEGEQLIGYAKQMLKLEKEMLNHFRQPLLKGEVTFGTPEDLATAYLPGILANFVKSYPGILLNVHCEFTMELLKGFDSQRYDLVLIKQDPRNPHSRSEEVWKEPLVWVCGKDAVHSNWKKEESLPLILAPAPCVYRQRAIDSLNREGIRWRIVYTSPSLTGTVSAVKAGLGISVLPMDMVPKEFQIVRDLPILKDAQIALLQQEHASESVKALADYVTSHIIINL
ncbi:MAG: LysR family transcriptional regulator [Chlamydiae bacterium]|nr:LysR family transcriptional regulator [Chlamydiota bacterium]